MRDPNTWRPIVAARSTISENLLSLSFQKNPYLLTFWAVSLNFLNTRMTDWRRQTGRQAFFFSVIDMSSARVEERLADGYVIVVEVIRGPRLHRGFLGVFDISLCEEVVQPSLADAGNLSRRLLQPVTSPFQALFSFSKRKKTQDAHHLDITDVLLCCFRFLSSGQRPVFLKKKTKFHDLPQASRSHQTKKSFLEPPRNNAVLFHGQLLIISLTIASELWAPPWVSPLPPTGGRIWWLVPILIFPEWHLSELFFSSFLA